MKVWAWLKRNAVWLGGMLATALLAILGGGWLWHRAHPRQAEITKGEIELARLDGIREAMLERVEETDEAIVVLDEQRRAKIKEIATARTGVDTLTDEEVEAEFRRMYERN